jgi:putative holliday junction resolvase
MAGDVARLRAICDQRQVVGLVIGLPLNMDGSEGAMATTMRGWARHLAGELALPVYLQDERLSSEAVRQAIDEGRLAKPRPGAVLDHFAAAVILEDALEALAT